MVKRPALDHQNGKNLAKKAKYEPDSKPVSGRFTHVDDVRTALRSQDVGTLTQALITLRNQFTIRFDEASLTPQDERLLLVKSWLEKAPGAQDVFSIVGRAPKPPPNVLSLCLSVLSSLLNLLSVHFVYHALGDSIIKTLLSPSHMRQLNSNLSDTSSELILSTLKVFNAMSTFAGGLEKRSVIDGFAWGQKSLQKLLFLRRKGKGARETDPTTRPDIRTLYINFVLSFLSNTTPTPIKLSLLEQHRDTFLLIFKGISQDPYIITRRVLEICWEGVWSDPKIKRTLKIGLFNEQTLNHLMKLYERDIPEDDSDDHVPADLVHHFMLAVTTRPGVGICFKDQGWYPRDNSSEDMAIKNADPDVGDEPTQFQGGKIYNKILANIVKGLKVNEDARQQELVLKILEACPELVTGYWGAVNLTLEPRLSSRWITNISVLGNIISSPIPTSSFLLPHSPHHNPSPPPLSSILANVLPSVLSKPHLTKGLQSSSSLVLHCTALVLSKCLFKLDNVLCVFRETAHGLEEDDETGQWLKRSRELQTEVERRVPDFMVIVAMVQQKHSAVSGEQGNAKAALLSESALRLLWLYHKLFPRLIAEVRFDIGKLLSVFNPTIDPADEDEMDIESLSIKEGQNGLDVLRQLHVLRLLKDSDQFAWSNKSGTSSHSHLHAIFTLYTKTSHAAVRVATSDLLTHILSSSILFSHDPAELDLWLASLPLTRRASGATAPDGTPLLDESTAVLAYLDDCIQRCSKTPYRYLEDALSFFGEALDQVNHQTDASLTPDDPSASPSPLLMTILEQLRAKIAANLLSPSDILAITTFIRKLTCSLTSKLFDLRHAWKIGFKLEEVLSVLTLSPQSTMVQDAIKRESDLLTHTLRFIEEPLHHIPISANPVVQDFLKQVEELPIPSSEAAASNAAYELVDWMRLIQVPLHPSEVKRLFGIVLRLSPSAATEFFYQLDPQLGQMWSIVDGYPQVLKQYLPFEWAYLHSTPAQLMQKDIMESLTSLFFSETPWNNSLERRVSLGIHRLTASGSKDGLSTSLWTTELSLLSSIIRHGRHQWATDDINRLKRALFLESDPLRELCCSRDISDVELGELAELVKLSLDPQTILDKELAVVYCRYWIAESESATNLRSCAPASPWIPFMEPIGVIKHLDVVISAVDGNYILTDTDQSTVDVILDTIACFATDAQVLVELQLRTRGLFAIRQSSHHHATLDNLLLLVMEIGLPLGCNALPLALDDSHKMADITSSAQKRWNFRSTPFPLDSTLISGFLHSENWDKTVAGMISSAIYRSSAARRTFWDWLTNIKPPEISSLGNVVIALHAYLDVMSLQSENDVTQLPDAWFLAVVHYLFRVQSSESVRARYIACISKEILDGQGGFLNTHSLGLLRDLHQLDAAAFSALLVDVIDEALKWMVRQLSGEEMSEEDISVLDELSYLISHTETKPHLVEPVLKTSIQNCLHMPNVIQCLIPLVSSTHLKPAIVNRHLQSIVQHAQLYLNADPTLPSRTPIVQLLHTLFHIHPNNTCQPSHIAPLTRLYGGTLSLSDRLLFSIFYLYENQRKESAASIFRNWSPSPSVPTSQDTLRAITNLDPARVFRTCATFPTRRSLNVSVVNNLPIGEEDLYDPAFLTLLVSQLLSERNELSTADWVQFFRSNIVSLVMCVLTSRNEAFRKVGITTLGGVLRRVHEADFLEKGQVIYIMDILRDLLPPPSLVLSAPRLTMYPVMLLAHALRSTFYPSSFLYPVVSRFLLQRPELDTTDVPLLYSLLYSSEDGEWAKERTWMIRFLTEAMNEGGARDWAVLKRRHTWDLVASMWQATKLEERSLRKSVLEFIANLSSNQHAVTSLIFRSSILAWIEMQLENKMPYEVEYVAWVKILENIVVTADGIKADKATRGEFSATLARCLCLVLCTITASDTSEAPTQISLLQLISRVLLRMARNDSGNANMLVDVLEKTTRILQRFEPLLAWTNDTKAWRSNNSRTLPVPPHRSRGLFSVCAGVKESTTSDTWSSLRTWAESVITLWTVAMMQPEGRVGVQTWDILTCRLLVLRALRCLSDSHSQSGNMDVGEWARRETLACLLQQDVKELSMEF